MMFPLVFVCAAVLSATTAAEVPARFQSLVSQLRKPLSYVDNSKLTISAYGLSRDILHARWSDSWNEDLPCSEPRNNGPVQKVGLGTQSPTLRLRIHESEVYVQEQLPIFVGCQVRCSNRVRFRSNRTAETRCALVSSINRLCNTSKLLRASLLKFTAVLWTVYRYRCSLTQQFTSS